MGFGLGYLKILKFGSGYQFFKGFWVSKPVFFVSVPVLAPNIDI